MSLSTWLLPAGLASGEAFPVRDVMFSKKLLVLSGVRVFLCAFRHASSIAPGPKYAGRIEQSEICTVEVIVLPMGIWVITDRPDYAESKGACPPESGLYMYEKDVNMGRQPEFVQCGLCFGAFVGHDAGRVKPHPDRIGLMLMSGLMLLLNRARQVHFKAF
jgi:hypothetical protein